MQKSIDLIPRQRSSSAAAPAAVCAIIEEGGGCFSCLFHLPLQLALAIAFEAKKIRNVFNVEARERKKESGETKPHNSFHSFVETICTGLAR
jgi:hypothetical protein